MNITKLVENKDKAIKKANVYFASLQRNLKELKKSKADAYKSKLTKENLENNSVFDNVAVTPKEYLDYIYNSEDFKQFVKYALIVKNISKKITNGRLPIIIGIIILTLILWLITKNATIAIIVGVLLLLVAVSFFAKQKTGMSYSDFYSSTMTELMTGILDEYSFKQKGGASNNEDKEYFLRANKNGNYYGLNKILNEDILSETFGKKYDHYTESNTLVYENREASGGICNLKMTKDVTKTDPKTDQEYKTEETIFNGFYIRSNMTVKANKLNNYVIYIRDDDNLLSALTEDTIGAIHTSDKEFTFNSEELNKALDCKIKDPSAISKAIKSGINKFKNTILKKDEQVLDGTQVLEEKEPSMLLHEVMTPYFENRLLYLKNRYNAFNMNLSDSYISFNVNLIQSIYQKIQAKEIFKNAYKRHTQYVGLQIPTLYTNDDFEYCKLFPMLEKMFFVHYINLLYIYAFKPNEVNELKQDIIEKFESEITEIMEMDYKDFKNMYHDDIVILSNDVKELMSNLYKEEG